ncbi:PilZ domain-containing protein [Alterisphingorhabdus coralli]|uniref:PilZ domain-containing protein n=1 Tax=Alterisphingorhabdus coralli TaxID=3071408 RepID=A0AA97I0Q0_9SPHN|nr:PilZ domain-containing protein [Parasphingorhabdus sp. SCSIO 66989]WOE74568.1 PilZ domain-containing protein [Parasphingorhabdus sp. SCSIO 66989]
MSRVFARSASPHQPPHGRALGFGASTPPAAPSPPGPDDRQTEDSAQQQARNQAEPRSSRLMRLRLDHPRFGLIDANIRNVSTHGMGGITDAKLSAGDTVQLCLHDRASVSAEVRWTRQERNRTAFGLRSEEPLDPASFAAKNDSATNARNWDDTVLKPLDEHHVYTRFRPVIAAKRPGFRRV